MTLPTIGTSAVQSEPRTLATHLQSVRGRWQYRVLFSNTALAHDSVARMIGVVVYFDNGVDSGQRTIVTGKPGRSSRSARRSRPGTGCRIQYGLMPRDGKTKRVNPGKQRGPKRRVSARPDDADLLRRGFLMLIRGRSCDPWLSRRDLAMILGMRKLLAMIGLATPSSHCRSLY